MEDLRLIVDLVLALAAAVVGGAVANRLRLPVLIGYIVAGLVIGPNTPGFVADQEQVLLMANLGVALLMFALGVEFSLANLRDVKRVALVGGAIQIPLTVVLGLAAGTAAGWSAPAATVLGGAFAISSSIVALKVLMGRGETGSRQARVAIGLGIVQDLSLVPMLALLPLLAPGGGEFLPGLLRSLGIAAAVLGAVAVVGLLVVPRVLEVAARAGSRELFLLTVVVIALGTALGAHEAGLSLGLGAFLAGLVVSESQFESQVLSDIIPLRDIFATLFFVSVGMLIDPALLIAEWRLVLALVAVLMVGKLLITGGALLAAGVDHRTASLASALLAQMGEFSFVLAGVALADAIIDGRQYRIVIGVALASILLLPALLALTPRLVAFAERLPGVATQERFAAGPDPADTELSGHVVLCGYGRVGAELGQALSAIGEPYVVIELNPAIVRELRRAGIPAYYGDSASDTMLHRAGAHRARSIAVATPDLVTSEGTIRRARAMNPDLRIIARAGHAAGVGILAGGGADEVVQPEFEAGLEFTRQVFGWQGLVPSAATGRIELRRHEVYGTGEAAASADAADEGGARPRPADRPQVRA